MESNINDLFLLNDLSIDREKWKKRILPIQASLWKVDNRGIVYDSRDHRASTTPLWDGTLMVRVHQGGRQVYRYVNDLVLRAFRGPPPSAFHMPFHRDGDRGNNYIENLSWVRFTSNNPSERLSKETLYEG